ncbi:hypothetical protein QBC46DRAFT_362981 [Diplogelasinospora grovesii]|uniref:Autophagy-related protein 29 n=1 Tax=Diplogelasinospora grovesii TaxID=303347 RepID=A0AAN6S664_9PEZI|nr:hypothetical protein QBC46DRAFT_362981 [Diplogelasinospora grovesii]
MERREPQYHVYVRLPFNRGDFVDPPPVNWDERKSEALWSILSGVSQTEIDCKAARFDVTVEFLLQLVSYLTERHTSQLRAQMRKAAATRGSNAPSPVPGAEASVHPTAEAMRRTGSGGGGRAPSALSIRKESPLPMPRNDARPSSPSTPIKTTAPIRPPVSRNSSANTTVLNQNAPTAFAAAKAGRIGDPRRRRISSVPITTTPPPINTNMAREDDPPSPGPADSPSSASSSSSESPIESRIIRRPPRFQAPDGAGGLGDGDDEEAEPAFLPFKPAPAQKPSKVSTSGSSGQQDLGATLRGDPRDFVGRRLPKGQQDRDLTQQSQTSDSSASSVAMARKRSASDRRPPGPLSPRRTAELAGRSPSGGKQRGLSREGSDGTPSMGSSFSDLDDASVTQSALEEALASRMQDGTIGSRMSTLGQAFRSRYLPKSNRP